MIDERPPQLDRYRRPRDPDRAPEPLGGGRSGVGGLFVIQQHAGRRLHYDLRLEAAGVLKSWAVPDGPSLRPEIERRAVHVEDHALEYADFEGVIPKDSDGPGAVIVWDHGRYRSTRPEDLLAQIERGLECRREATDPDDRRGDLDPVGAESPSAGTAGHPTPPEVATDAAMSGRRRPRGPRRASA